MAGKGRLDADFRRFQVPHFPHQDDIRVLAQKRPEGRGEGQVDLFPDLHLVDSLQVEFHRIFGGHNIVRGFVQLADGGVEGGGFAAAGGAGDQDHAVGLVDGLFHLFQGLFLEAQLGHVQLQVGLVQQAQDYFFAEQGGQHRNPEVHGFVFADLHLDAAVLGQAPFGDVQLGHDLHPGSDGVFQLHRRLHYLVEHAVNAVADPEHLFVGLQVDVAGALADGIHEDVVDQADDRGVFGFLFQLGNVQILFFLDQFQLAVIEGGQDVFKHAGRVKELFNGLLDHRFRSHDDFNIVTSDELYVINGGNVGGVAGGDDQGRTHPVDGNGKVLVDQVGGNQGGDLFVDFEVPQVDGRHPVLDAEEVDQVVFADVAKLDQVGPQPAAVHLLFLQGLGQLGLGDQLGADQHFPQPFVLEIHVHIFFKLLAVDGFVTTPSSSLRGNLRHCDVLYVRLIPQVLRASNLEPLLCHRFSRHYYSCYEFISCWLLFV